MRSLAISLSIFGAVIGIATHALALNPQPLPPGIKTHITATVHTTATIGSQSSGAGAGK